jgi:hypothetical protein
MADARRIIILDGADYPIGALDISEIENANTQCVLRLAVETRCDLGDWHRGQVVDLLPWGRKIK